MQDIQIQSDKVNTSKSFNRKGTYSFWGRHLAGKIFVFKITSPFSDNKILQNYCWINIKPMNKTKLIYPFPKKVILSLIEKLGSVKASRNTEKFYSLLWYSSRLSQLTRRKKPPPKNVCFTNWKPQKLLDWFLLGTCISNKI